MIIVFVLPRYPLHINFIQKQKNIVNTCIMCIYKIRSIIYGFLFLPNYIIISCDIILVVTAWLNIF